MILSRNSNPQRELYYLGAQLLDVFQDREKMDFFNAYLELKKQHHISFRLFMLTIDWLYLLGAIKSEGGMLVKCT